MPDAWEVVEQINRKFELYLVSAAMEFPNSLQDKFNGIMEQLPFISGRQVCVCGSKRTIQTDIMIDDRSRNFAHFSGPKIRYAACHNIWEQRYERVEN